MPRPVVFALLFLGVVAVFPNKGTKETNGIQAEVQKVVSDLRSATGSPVLRTLQQNDAGGKSRQCSPTLFRVEREPHGHIKPQFTWNSLSVDDVLNHVLLTLPFTQFGKVPETPFSNLDGRIAHPVLGAMGGDAGEFLLALNTFESLVNKELTEFQVASLLSDYLLLVDKSVFLLQTDQMALVSLCRRIKFCLPDDRLDNPPAAMLPSLRSELIRPEHIGCSHIKHILQDPDSFNTRKGLVEAFIVSFYNLLWGVPVNGLSSAAMAIARSKLKLQVLSGPHTEGAILRVDSSKCSPRFVPMVIPEYGKISIGVSHIDAVGQLREIAARFLNEQGKKMGIVHSEESDDVFEKRLKLSMDKLADQQFEVARKLDQGKTPVYTLRYPAECCMGTGTTKL